MRREIPPYWDGGTTSPPEVGHRTFTTLRASAARHRVQPQQQPPARPAASGTCMAQNVMRWTTRIGETVDVAGASDPACNVTFNLALSGFPPYPEKSCTRTPTGSAFGGAAKSWQLAPVGAPGRGELQGV